MTRKIVVAVPSRPEFVRYLKTRIPDVEFCFDMEAVGAMQNTMNAWKMAGEDPVLMMEDDIILTVGFNERVEEEIQKRPNEIIQFFSMRSDDLTKGSRYDRKFAMNQCYYLPKGYASLLLEYASNWSRRYEAGAYYDIMMDEFLRGRKEKYWIHVPSLVQHRDGKSMIHQSRSSKRQSKTFVNAWE